MKRTQRLERVNAIARECFAATFASQLLDEELKRDSALLVGRSFDLADVRHWEENLSGTYIIRIFAEFEAALRDVWANYFHRDTVPPMRDLIDAIGTHRQMPALVINNAHKVRSYRNNLVHESDEENENLPLELARRHVNTFLSWLPLDW